MSAEIEAQSLLSTAGYVPIKVLGEGAFGKVRRANTGRHKTNYTLGIPLPRFGYARCSCET